MSGEISELQKLLTDLEADPKADFFQDFINEYTEGTIDKNHQQAVIKEIEQKYQITIKVKEAELM